jgi:hypothetical protein
MRFAAILSITAFCAAARAADMADADGDGLPDLWEAHWGLSTNALTGASGSSGRDGDPDGDGLSNWAEYSSGYLDLGGGNVYSNYGWAVAGLCPTNADSLGDGLGDYWLKAAPGHLVTLGWLYSDRDRVADSWERGRAWLSPHVYDEHADDGWIPWDAWHRCQADAAGVGEPEVEFTVRGVPAAGAVTAEAWSDLAAASPDAVYTLPASSGVWRARASSGALRQSSRWLITRQGASWQAGRAARRRRPLRPRVDGGRRRLRAVRRRGRARPDRAAALRDRARRLRPPHRHRRLDHVHRRGLLLRLAGLALLPVRGRHARALRRARARLGAGRRRLRRPHRRHRRLV